MRSHSPVGRFLLATCLALTTAWTANAATIVVDGNGGGDFLTIQEAIDNAVDGDTILVMPGLYIEDVLVDKELTIVSNDGAATTTVFPSTTNPGVGDTPQFDTATHLIRVTASNVTIDGLTLDGDNTLLPNNPDARTAIIVDSRGGAVDNLSVDNCVITNIHFRGILILDGGTTNAVSNTSFSVINSNPARSTALEVNNATASLTALTIDDVSFGISLNGAGTGNAITNCVLTNINNNAADSLAIGVDNSQVDITGANITNATHGISITNSGVGQSIADSVLNDIDVDALNSTAISVDGSTIAISNTSVNTASQGIILNNAGTGNTIDLCLVENVNTDASSTGIGATGSELALTNSGLSNCTNGVIYDGSDGSLNSNQVTLGTMGYSITGNTAPLTLISNRATGCTTGFRTVGNNASVTLDRNILLACTTGIEVMGGVAASAVIDLVGNSIEGASNPSSIGMRVTSDLPDLTTGDVQCTIRGNAIFRNGKGIVVEETDTAPVIDLTISGGDGEENHFFGTSAPLLELIGCDDNVNAVHNFWGTTELSRIETLIVHKSDNGTLGYVDFSDPVAGSPLLTLTGEPRIGTTIDINLFGLFGELFFLLYAPLPAEIPFEPYGTLLLDPVLMRILLGNFAIPFGGVFSVQGDIPEEPAFVGITIHFQALVGFDISNGVGKMSNSLSFTFLDNS